MKRLALFMALVLLLTALTVGCAQNESLSSTFFFMDTVITVTLYTNDVSLASRAFEECRALLADLEALWSPTAPTSEVLRINGSVQVVPEERTAALLSLALDVSQRTDGAFDVTVAPLIALWREAGESDRLPDAARLQEALQLCDYRLLTLRDGLLTKWHEEASIDLGGIGKGAAADALLALLSTYEIQGGLVSFGSNVAPFGKKPNGKDFRVAIRDPRDSSASVGTLLMQGGDVLSVSGDYERFVTVEGERYHHLLDPATGYPADTGLASVAVVCKSGALADALSTALFVMGWERALALYESGVYSFEAVAVTVEGELLYTAGMNDIFTESK